MASEQTRGRCRLCDRIYARPGMTRHIRTCGGRAPGGRSRALLLELHDRYRPQYWLVLEVPRHTSWADLDEFVRDVWVGCCDHLSAFTVASMTFAKDREGAMGWAEDARSMDRPIIGAVAPGTQFGYEYDFGTTTELVGRALALVPAATAAGPVRVLARNEPPLIACAECAAAATCICILCQAPYDDSCVGRHPCAKADPAEGFRLPIVNSPRIGLCAYTGPSTE